ncbi:hypothetical protein BKA70DRAFT_1400350 [Coprinopsis sp. MPI-PUGE-AT-0042]|nr:hypothetical protein BKA70DRAFT_1400350 [Coprinopsis sp. MPI-PUGE-AT-0042]
MDVSHIWANDGAPPCFKLSCTGRSIELAHRATVTGLFNRRLKNQRSSPCGNYQGIGWDPRMLDTIGHIHPACATERLFRTIREVWEGAEIEDLVEALFDLGASMHHPCETVIFGGMNWKSHNGFYDALHHNFVEDIQLQAAIEGQERLRLERIPGNGSAHRFRHAPDHRTVLE